MFLILYVLYIRSLKASIRAVYYSIIVMCFMSTDSSLAYLSECILKILKIFLIIVIMSVATKSVGLFICLQQFTCLSFTHMLLLFILL